MLKKFLLGGLLLFLPFSVNALEFKEDTVVTQHGFSMSYDKYYMLSERLYDVTIDNLPIDTLEILVSDNLTHIAGDSKNVVSNYYYDENGNVEKISHYNVGDKEFNIALTNDNKLTRDVVNNKSYETSYKVVTVDAFMYNDIDEGICYFLIEMSNSWKKTPSVKSYDVIATRWTGSSVTVFDANGGQYCESPVNYSYMDDNMVKKSNGLGISMNFVDSCTVPQMVLYVYAHGNFGTVFGTYQHATRTVSLSQSKSYNFASTGLGGVLDFTNNTVESYYDDMSGVKIVTRLNS